MKEKTIKKETLVRFFVIIFLVFFFFNLLSVLILKNNLIFSMGPHYAAAFSLVPKFKESLMKKTVIINILSFLFTAAGMALMGVIYSHRVSGPLFKLKKHVKNLGTGRFEEKIQFRKNDAVQDLTVSLNQMVDGYRERIRLINISIATFEETLSKDIQTSEYSEINRETIKKLRSLDEKINDELQNLII